MSMSKSVTSITRPIAFSSSVIGMYAMGALLNDSGAITVTHLFSRHLSFTFPPFRRANYYRRLNPKYKLLGLTCCFVVIFRLDRRRIKIFLQRLWNADVTVLCLKVLQYGHQRPSCRNQGGIKRVNVLRLLVGFVPEPYL